MTGPESSGALRLAGGGIQLAVLLIGGLHGGQWLDRRFATAPVFLYVGVAVGAICGFAALYRQLMRVQRDEEEARQR